jgi:hypothetical protein
MRYTLVVLLLLAGCTAPVTMVNPQSGQTAKCGPFPNTWGTPDREAKCIDDYRSQGYVRR